MHRRIPPLNALRSFEAAARHLSFTKAAEELNVTPAAVSHQVKSLEAYLGLALFRRLTRGLALTDHGETYLPDLTAALDRIAAATSRMLADELSGTIKVSCLPSFAMRWLVPRLSTLREIHPTLDVDVEARWDLVDFRRDDVDAAIRYGIGGWPGLHDELLLTESIFPVCSPALLEGSHPLRVPADLRHQTLLHDTMVTTEERWYTWAPWIAWLEVEGVDLSRGPRFSDSNMLLQAAIDGQGVALGRTAIVADELADGSLVKPFDIERPADYTYYFVCPNDAVDHPRIRAFRDWLFTMAEPGAAAPSPR